MTRSHWNASQSGIAYKERLPQQLRTRNRNQLTESELETHVTKFSFLELVLPLFDGMIYQDVKIASKQ